MERISKKQQTILIILTLLFGFVYFFRLFTLDYFLNHAEEVIASGTWRALYIILRFFTQGAVLAGLVTAFIPNRHFRNIMAFFIPLVCILNLIFLKTNLDAFVGIVASKERIYRAVQFLLEIVLLLTLSFAFLVIRLKENKTADKKLSVKELSLSFLIFFLVSLAVLPQFTFYGLYGEIGKKADGLNQLHRLYLYIIFGLLFVSYFTLRSKSYETRNLFCVIMAIAGFITYFDKYSFESMRNLSSWPLHLCNTALMLMFFAFIFKLQTLFYFNYFINVLGAFLAILMPNTTGDAFLPKNFHFWYNHMYAFTLPILGVALKIFPRPKFKGILYSLLVFTLYFIGVAFINAWWINYDKNVNYFFLADDFFIDKFSFAYPWKYNHIVEISLKNGLVMKIYPVYWTAIYFVYVLLTFVMWYVYDFLFKVADSHFDLYIRKKRMRMEKKIKAATAGATMIKISHFTKIYGKSNKKAVDDFSLEVRGGEIFGFLGHNGAGKSTLIKSMVGIHSITSGKIEICGFDISKNSVEAKQLIGYVPDNHAVYEGLTGREYINYVANLYLVPEKEREERLNRYLKMFNLENDIDRLIKGYSHGMKQKVLVIAALIHDPKIWILDEPLTGLDPMSSYQIKECMRLHARAGNIVFFSSHVIEVVENICDRVAIISGGRLRDVYAIDELKAKGLSLEEICLKDVINAG